LFFIVLALAYADDDKIIGGTELSPNQVPYLVNLKRFGSLMCGGSLLTSTFAVSAAHCDSR